WGTVREGEIGGAGARALNPGGSTPPKRGPEPVREQWQSQRGIVKPATTVSQPPAAPAVDPLVSDKPTLDELSRRYAERILRETGGNKTKAAEVLGIDRKTLSRLLREE